MSRYSASLSIDNDNLMRLEAFEKATGMSKNDMVNEALRRYWPQLKEETGIDEVQLVKAVLGVDDDKDTKRLAKELEEQQKAAEESEAIATEDAKEFIEELLDEEDEEGEEDDVSEVQNE